MAAILHWCRGKGRAAGPGRLCCRHYSATSVVLAFIARVSAARYKQRKPTQSSPDPVCVPDAADGLRSFPAPSNSRGRCE
jgi:hypothetical protein